MTTDREFNPTHSVYSETSTVSQFFTFLTGNCYNGAIDIFKLSICADRAHNRARLCHIWRRSGFQISEETHVPIESIQQRC